MTELLEDTRKHVESLVEDLTGDDDFMPFMVCEGREGTAIVGLMMPDNDERDDMADVIAAMLAAWQATEAVFASAAWAVMGAIPMDIGPAVLPSQHPARQEIVFVVHAGSGGDEFQSAPLNRMDGKVSMGEWTGEPQEAQLGGRFADAMHMGIHLGANLPAAIADDLREVAKTVSLEEAIRPLVGAFRRLRQEQT